MSVNPEKKFGLLFFLVFLIIGLWPLLKNNDIRIWAVIISLFFLISSMSLKFLVPMNNFGLS